MVGGRGALSVEKRGWSGYYVKFRADYDVSSSVKVVFIGVQKVCVSCHTIMHYVRHWMVKLHWWHWLKLHWLLVCALTVSDYMDLSVCFPTVLFAWTQGSVCYCEVSQRENGSPVLGEKDACCWSLSDSCAAINFIRTCTYFFTPTPNAECYLPLW